MLTDEPLPEPASSIPAGFEVYKRTPEFTESSVPDGLLRAHSTKPDTWGRIQVAAGVLRYCILDERRRQREFLLTPGSCGVIEPEIVHRVEPLGPVKFSVDFLRQHRRPAAGKIS
jgi:tellurite resistance-related uncharacterized protein